MAMQQRTQTYDLDERTYEFARRVRAFLRTVRRTISNAEDGKQLIRSSGSVGANYIEANECLGSKDFLMHLKICREEAKESRYWLRLIDLVETPNEEPCRALLIRESEELIRIFSAIIRNRQEQKRP